MASIHFYHYFFELNNQAANYDIIGLVDNIWENTDDRQKTVSDNNHWYSMSAHWQPIGQADDNTIRYFWIDKSLNNNPWTGNLGTANRRRVPGHLYQPATCLLVPASQTLIVYQPQGSPSSKEIANYLEKYIEPTDSDDEVKIILKTITTDLTFNALNANFEIKKISLTIDPENFDMQNAFPGYNNIQVTEDIVQSLDTASTAIRNLGGETNDMPALTFEIKKIGRRNPMNFMFTEFLRNGLVEQGHGILKAEIVVRRPERTSDEVIRLGPNSNLLQTFPANEDITGYEALFRILNERFNSNGFPQEAFDAVNLPDMININDEDIMFVDEPEGVLTEEVMNNERGQGEHN